MIDLFSATIDVPHDSFGSEREIRRENNTGGTKHLTKRILINRVPVLVTSLDNGKQINIRCCALKVLQGHNIFGTNNLKKLWCQVLTEVLNLLSIDATEEQLSAWHKGEFQIKEIHLTHHFYVNPPWTTKRIVSDIHRYTRMSLAPSIIKNGTGVTLRAPHRLAEWTFYDKYREFDDKRIKEHIYLEAHVGDDGGHTRRLLQKSASNCIRAELKLDKAYLEEHHLDRGKCWNPSKVMEVYWQELTLLHLGEIPSLPELPQIYKQIDDMKMRSVVILWANGENLADHYGRTTLEKYRRAIKNMLSIDILKEQPVLEKTSIKLSDIFDPANMVADFPEWVEENPSIVFQ